jgi:hypothetical protein
MDDQWARRALNGNGRAHWHAEQDGIHRNIPIRWVTYVEGDRDEAQRVGSMS